jgi:hypothetical protein
MTPSVRIMLAGLLGGLVCIIHTHTVDLPKYRVLSTYPQGLHNVSYSVASASMFMHKLHAFVWRKPSLASWAACPQAWKQQRCSLSHDASRHPGIAVAWPDALVMTLLSLGRGPNGRCRGPCPSNMVRPGPEPWGGRLLGRTSARRPGSAATMAGRQAVCIRGHASRWHCGGRGLWFMIQPPRSPAGIVLAVAVQRPTFIPFLSVCELGTASAADIAVAKIAHRCLPPNCCCRVCHPGLRGNAARWAVERTD